jgi:coiled-coil domain-containing protein 55
MKAAEDRKKEMERRMERKMHKEREAEKGKYDDKESFVTEAYRQKMELMRQEEENERKKEQMQGS